jgi:hypothetical protein
VQPHIDGRDLEEHFERGEHRHYTINLTL